MVKQCECVMCHMIPEGAGLSKIMFLSIGCACVVCVCVCVCVEEFICKGICHVRACALT